MPYALGFAFFVLAVSISVAGLATRDHASGESAVLADAMLTARFYAERSFSETSGAFAPADAMPASVRSEYRDYEISGFVDDGVVYIYSVNGPLRLLEKLTEQTEGSLNVGIVEQAGVMKSSSGLCRSKPTSCTSSVPKKLPVGAVVIRAGNS